MNKFICVFYRSDDQREEIRQRLEQRFRAEITYPIGRFHLFDVPVHRMLVCSAESKVSPAPIHYLDIGENSGLICDGLPYTDDIDPKGNWAHQLRALMTRGRHQEFFRRVMGGYAVAHFDQHRFMAFGDFMGMCPIFQYYHDGVFAVSNRQRLLHCILHEDGRPEVDPAASAWLISQNQIFGTKSPYRGVRLIKPGEAVRVSDGDVKVVRLRSFYRQPKSDDLSPAMVRLAVDAIVDQARAFSRIPFRQIRMDLTGGMDSRAVLAVAIGSGLIDRVDEIYTRGNLDSPDVEVAASLAHMMGLPHSVGVPGVAGEYSREACWRRIRLSAQVFDGAITPQEVAAAGPTELLGLSGSGGEIYRPHVKKVRNQTLGSLQEAYDWIVRYQGPIDPVGLLKTDIRERHAAKMREIVDDFHRQKVPFDDMHYTVYVEHRLPWWAGYIHANVGGRRRVTLLANQDAASVMFSVDPVHKKIDRLHFELMKAIDPRLAEHPFLGNSWDERLTPFADGLSISQPSYKTAKKDTVQARGKGWVLEFADDAFDDLIDLALASPLADAVNIEKLKKIRPRIKAGQLKAANALLSMVTTKFAASV